MTDRVTDDPFDEGRAFHLLMAGVRDYAIIMLNNSGHIISWNVGAERIKGYKRDEILGRHFSAFYTSEDKLIGKPAYGLQQALQNGKFEDQGWRLRKDRTRFFANVSIFPLYDESRNQQGFAKVTQDITLKREAEQELQLLKQRLSLALHAGEIGVWELNVKTGKVWRSARHDEIFGYTNFIGDWTAETFLQHVDSDDLNMVKEAFEEASSKGKLNSECWIHRNDGLKRRIKITGETVKRQEGKPLTMVGTLVDMTDHQLLEDQRRHSAILEEREEFMATLTHDMKNPLIGSNQILTVLLSNNSGLNSEERRLLEILRQSNIAVLRLIQNLISVYKNESQHILTIENFDLEKLLEAVVARISQFASLQNVTLSFDRKMDETRIDADYELVERVLQNLLDNAVKFSPPRSLITVSLASSDTLFIIDVEDEGRGVPLQERPHLFQKFSQLDDGQRHAGGSGLGLYLCKQIVEMHGGLIEYVDSDARGAHFRVSLPKTAIARLSSI